MEFFLLFTAPKEGLTVNTQPASSIGQKAFRVWTLTFMMNVARDRGDDNDQYSAVVLTNTGNSSSAVCSKCEIREKF